MKKKGLIISTVVMVVVLIASLTTATYAWFTASGSASVSDITFKVSAASDLVIGVSKTNSIVTNPQWASFVSDETEYNATVGDGNRGTWTGVTDGLGLSVNTGLQLDGISKAVYTFTNVSGEGTTLTGTPTDYTKGDGTSVTKGFDVTNGTALLASGNGSTISEGTYEAAVRNNNYLDVAFGVSAAKSDVLSFGCLVTIDNNNTSSSLGMNAAIHVAYSYDGTNYTELDVYGNSRAGDPISGLTAPTAPKATIGEKSVPYESPTITGFAKGDATVWIPLQNATDAATYAKTGIEGVKQLHLIIYICGPDSDCVTNAEASSLIKIEFLSVNKGMYDSVTA